MRGNVLVFTLPWRMGGPGSRGFGYCRSLAMVKDDPVVVCGRRRGRVVDALSAFGMRLRGR